LEKRGHVNTYNFKKLTDQIENYYGKTIDYYYTNIFDELVKRGRLSSGETITSNKRFMYNFASMIFKVSPEMSSKIFTDYVMILAKIH
jgi:hypothetical protein